MTQHQSWPYHHDVLADVTLADLALAVHAEHACQCTTRKWAAVLDTRTPLVLHVHMVQLTPAITEPGVG
jgi:hypothetical protein